MTEKPFKTNDTAHRRPDHETGAQDEFLRAPHEDDDGYDPYSDRREFTPLFERDPWN